MTTTMNRLLAALIFCAAGLIHPYAATYVKYFDTLQALLASNPNDVSKMATVRSMTGGSQDDGSTLYYDKNSVLATNTESIFKPTGYGGRWIRVLSLGGSTADDAAYGASWDGSTNPPTQNSVYDKVQSLVLAGGGDVTQAGDNNFTGSNTVSGITTSLPVEIQRGTNTYRYSSLLTASDALQNGDVMTVAAGTYNVPAPYYTTDDADVSAVDGIVLRNLTNVVIQGVGWDSVIAATNYGNLITIENCTGITVRNIKLVGSTNDIGTKTIVGMVNHKLTNGMTRAESVYFYNAPDQGWTHCFEQHERRSTEWQIVNCVFENVGQTNHPALNLVVDGACVSGRPEKLIFTGNRTKGLIALAVIEMDGGGDSDPAAYTFGDTIIADNVLEGLYQQGIMISGYENNVVDGMQIYGNHFAFHPTYVISGTARHINVIGAKNISIFGNRFTGAIEDAGGFRPYGVLFWETYGDHPNTTNITIKANSFEGMAFGIGVSTGTNIANTISGVTVQDNTFIDQGESSIYFAGSNWTIDGNTFLGCGRAPIPTYYMAILAADLAYARLTNAVITDNVLNDIADTPTTLVFVYYESAVNPPMPITIRDNEAIRQGVAPTYVFPAGTSYATFPNRTFVSPGDSTAPAIAPVNDQNSGIYFYNGATVFVEDAIGIAVVDDRGMLIDDTGFFGWNQPDWAQADVRLYRGGPGTLEQRWGTVPNTNRIFTSYTDTNNYEGFAIETRVGSVDLKGITAGTGWDDITLNLAPAGAGTVNATNITSRGVIDGKGTGVLTNIAAIYMANANYTNEWAGLIVTNLFIPGLASTNLGVDANGKVIAVAGGTGGVSSWNDLTDIPAGFADDIDNTGGSTNLTDSGTSVTVAGGLTLNGDLTVNGTNSAVWSFADADSTDPEKVDIGAATDITVSHAWELPANTNNTPGYLYATPSGTNRLGKPRFVLSYAIPSSSGVAVADIDTSAEIRNIVGDESGTGALLFAGGAIGAATATTPAENDNDTSVATTAYVQTEIASLGSGATNIDYGSANTYTATNLFIGAGGATNVVTALAAKAPLAGPVFTGDPTVPNVILSDSDLTAANTAFVKSNITVAASTLQTGSANLTNWSSIGTNLMANLVSPALTGNPTAPTASADDNDTSISTTAFVQGELAAATNWPHLTVNAVAYNATSWNGSTNVPTMDAVRDQMETKIASGGNIGAATATTASAADNDTSVATTAFTVSNTARSLTTSITVGTTYAWDLDGSRYQRGTMSGNSTFSTSNRSASVAKEITAFITASGADRTVTLPSDWKVYGTNATTVVVASGSTMLLSILSTGSAESDVIASYSITAD
jgi:hypothetical protein